jgi:hypothetical protein
MVIVEDTLAPGAGYDEPYPGQTNRIKSSVVYPVLSSRNAVLGTLVVHCDKVRFFRTGEGRYWREVLEIFAARIALERARL